MPHALPNAIARWLRTRQLNPVLVKEARQSVRSNQLVGVIALLLLFLVAYSIIFLAAVTGARDAAEGRGEDYLVGLMLILGGALGLAALDSLRRLVQEREPGNQDMLYVTPLSPGALVRGKALSGLAQALLILSLGLPFLVLAYFLRGIGLPAILCAGIVLALAASALTFGGIFAAALPLPTPLKWLLFIAFGVLVGFGHIGLSFTLVQRGSDLTLNRMLGIALTLVPAFWALYAAGVFLLSPPQANRALPLRLTYILLTLAWFAGSAAVAVIDLDPNWLQLAIYATLGLVALSLILTLLCPELTPRRIRDALPRRRFLRFLVLPLWEGRAGGLLWTLLWNAGATGLFALTALLLGGLGDDDMTGAIGVLAIGSGYLLCYALTACWLERAQRRWIAGIPAALLFPPLAAAGSLLSFALTQVLAHSAWHWWHFPALGCVLPLEDSMDTWFMVHVLFMLLWLTLAIESNRNWLFPAIRTTWHGPPPKPT